MSSYLIRYILITFPLLCIWMMYKETKRKLDQDNKVTQPSSCRVCVLYNRTPMRGYGEAITKRHICI